MNKVFKYVKVNFDIIRCHIKIELIEILYLFDKGKEFEIFLIKFYNNIE
jgi:hypothetical protein